MFAWAGADWSQVCDTVPGMLQISEDGLLFIGDGWTGTGVWRMRASGDRLEYCLGPKAGGTQTIGPGATLPPNPLWHLPQALKSGPQGLPASSLTVTSRKSDLLLLVDHAKAEHIINERDHVITGTRVLAQDGYHASLLCFSSNYAEPQDLHLRFDDIGAVLPVSGRVSRGPMIPGSVGPWLAVGSDRLYLGCEVFHMPLSGARAGDLPRIGVWVVSFDQLDQEVARQKRTQDLRREQKATASQRAAQKLLDDFDRNRDGQIDDEEKESALTNEDFVASQLTQIDADQNGWLDAGELAFFDANKNKVLDANEQAGIEHALSLFAAQLVRTFDLDSNGLLDRREFSDLLQSSPGSRTRPMMNSPFFDDNHDGLIDVEEIQALCRFQIGQGLSGWSFAGPMVPGSASGNDPKQRFKEQVDRFWQKGGTNAGWRTNGPGFPRPPVPVPVQAK